MLNQGSITRAYDAVSDQYAAKWWNEFENKHFDRIMLPWFASQVPRGERVLEIGAGPGEVSGYLSSLGVECVITDASPRMVENARRYFPHLRCEVADFSALPFADASFFGVAAYYAMVNFPLSELEPVFREVCRVLRPGGLFLFTFHVFQQEDKTVVREFFEQPVDQLTFYYFKVDEMKGLVAKVGYQILDVVVRQPYPELEYPSQRAYFLVQKG